MASSRLHNKQAWPKNASMAAPYGEFFAQFAWNWFATLTFAFRLPPPAISQAFQKFANSLEQAVGAPIFWVRVIEKGDFGRCHLHALIGNVMDLDRTLWEKRWSHGHARILIYDAGGGAAFYVAKTISRVDCELSFSDSAATFFRLGISSIMEVIDTTETRGEGSQA